MTLARVAHEDGRGVLRAIRTVPDVEQGFGGILTAAGPPSSAGLPCRTRDAAALGRRALTIRAPAARASR